MLRVPSVAMIDGSRKKRMRVALARPVAMPIPTSASAPGISSSVEKPGCIVNDDPFQMLALAEAFDNPLQIFFSRPVKQRFDAFLKVCS